MASSSKGTQEDFDYDLREKCLKDTKIWQQGECNSCWAITGAFVSSGHYNSTLTVEANDADKTNYIEAAPQELVDRVHLRIPSKKEKIPDKRDCFTNTTDNSFRYIKQYGVAMEKDYPYQGRCGRGNIYKENVRLKIDDGVKIIRRDGKGYECRKLDDDEKFYLSKKKFNDILRQKPIATALRITPELLMFTGKGIYDGNFLDEAAREKAKMQYAELLEDNKVLYHAVPIIGHGIEKGVHYVKVQNSWGEDWGDNGCAKIRSDQICLDKTSWPTNNSALEIDGSIVENPMCLTSAKLYNELFAEKAMRILMVGLDGAGKTTILDKLDLGKVTNTYSRGFKLKNVYHDNLTITAWDVDGQQQSYPIPGQEFGNPNGLIFVVDSNGRQRIADAKKVLHKMLAENQNALRDAVVLIFANKQDLPSAMHHSVIIRKLDLHSIVEHRWYIQGTSASSGYGIYEGLKWMSVSISNQA